jgi:hypothetical protein
MTARKPALHVVAEEPIDICALNRADILERDWSAVHVAADKRPAITLGDRVKRTWFR